MLDVYANSGGWALHALRAGATSAIAIDKSEACAEQVLVNADLNGRRARIMGMDSEGDVQIIKARVPVSEMQTYSTLLRSITAGEGSYTLEFSHYDVVPPNVMQTIIAKAKAAAQEAGS